MVHGAYGISEIGEARYNLKHGHGDRAQNVLRAVKGAGDIMTGIGHYVQGVRAFNAAVPSAFPLTLAGIGIATIASFGEILSQGK